MLRPHTPYTMTRWMRLTLAGALVAGSIGLAGCEWLARGSERLSGTPVVAQYPGLVDKSVAIVIYADPATSLEYTAAREEVAAFITAQFQEKMPKVRLLNYHDVIRWQDETLNWQAVPEKDIGKHFSVDRVLYVELLEYSTREPGSQDLLRGRIRALCKTFEVDNPGAIPAWKNEFQVYWPENVPEDVSHSSDLVVRKRVLESFSEKLISNFYDHRDMEKSVHEKAE